MLLSTPPPGRSVRAVCTRCARLVHAVWTRCARGVHPVCTHGSPRALAARPQAGRGVAPGAEGTPASPSVTAAPRLSPFALPRRPTQRKILNLNGQQGCDGFHCATPVSRANKYQGADRAGPNRQTAPLAFRGRRRACVASSSSSPGPQGAAPARAGASHSTAGLANVPPTPRRLAGPSGAAGRRGDARVAPASCSAPPARRTPLTKHGGPTSKNSEAAEERTACGAASAEPVPQRRPGTRRALPRSPRVRE